MKINAILINEKDNVVTTLEPTEKDTKICYKEKDTTLEIMLLNDVPSYHKVSTVDIQKGQNIIKYGEIIGIATKDITKGQHVSHLNIDSLPRDYKKESVIM